MTPTLKCGHDQAHARLKTDGKGRYYWRCRVCITARERELRTGAPTSAVERRAAFLAEYTFLRDCGDRGAHLLERLGKEFGIKPRSVERRLQRAGLPT